jgi:hypothetical protein
VAKDSYRSSNSAGNIYIGVGGWTFAPWRGVFYPEKLTQAKELEIPQTNNDQLGREVPLRCY